MQKQNMQVVLLEKSGFRYSLWLPVEREGRYEFPKNEHGVAPDVCIVGDGERWTVVDSQKEEIIYGVLESGVDSEINISRHNEKYTLYVEDSSDGNKLFLPYTFEKNCEIVLGRHDTCDLVYGLPSVSKRHVSFYHNDGNWFVRDLGSLNGTYLNNRLVSESVIKPGDKIYVMGACIICGVNYFAINNADGKIMLASHKVRAVNSQKEIEVTKPEEQEIIDYFERSPRGMYIIPTDPIEFQMPPMSIKGGKMPLLLRMGNSILSGGSALLMGNLMSATTSLFLPGLTQGLTEKEQKEYEEKRYEMYQHYLNEMKKEILNEKRFEEIRLNEIYPELNRVVSFAEGKERLWERRRFDEDFLKVRMGHCRLPLMAEVKYPPKKLEVERDELVDAMYSIAENKIFLDDAPVMMSLSEDYIIGVKGERSKKIDFLRNLILQIAFSHSYDEVKIVLLGKKMLVKDLEFVKYLPHNWSNDKTVRFFAETRSDVQQFSMYLNKLLEEGEEKKTDSKDRISYVIIVLNKDLYDYVEGFKTICSDGYRGFSLITAFDNMPKECKKLVSFGGVNKFIDLINPGEDILGVEMDSYDERLVKDGLRNLGNMRLRLDEKDFSLPNSVEFLEMYDCTRVEHLNPLKRWKDNDPTKSLAAPIGVGGDGKLFTLDLHEKKQGPHGLIAGGTGSGKSEFIITYILSMAINYSPDEVAFILIDYKGGGLADAFVDEKKGIHLPHVVGTITNLDGSAISRSLLSIHSELKRRQTVFKNAKSATNEGTMDIYDYQRLYRNGKVTEPMPHLFIISDEFAELKKQQPEFMDELISTARIGRSLGVHLILATQKPTGVVNDQIWSNTKFRVCLKVAEKSDSQEMLKRPEAAEIKNTGRFYLQVGYNDFFAQGQAAWCGAGYNPGETKKVDANEEIEFVDNVGHRTYVARPIKEKKKAQSKQIVAIVQYLSELAQREGIVPDQLWRDPLPERIEYDSTPRISENDKIIADMGIVDDPENQTQYSLDLDVMSFHHMLVVGPSGSGKSEFLKTMLYSLTEKYSTDDVNYYLADFSRGALSEFAPMPHCGAYITESDERSFERLLTLITDIAETRKQQFIENHITTFEGYRKIGRMPAILIVIDGYAALRSFKKGNDIHSGLYEYMKKCSAYGMKFIISVDRIMELYSRTRQEADKKIAFQAKDKYEYADILDAKNAVAIPALSGRCELVFEGRPLEAHISMVDSGRNEFERSENLKNRINELKDKWKAGERAVGLEMMRAGETYAEFIKYFSAGRIPIGYYLKDLRRIAIPLKQLHSLSLYVGNPLGKDAYIGNFLLAARQNAMRVLFVRKTVNSFLDDVKNQDLYRNMECFHSTQNDVLNLSEIITGELAQRRIYRDEYCRLNNIPLDFSEKVIVASEYIREHTTPILVLFESLGELCRLEENDLQKTLIERYGIIFSKTKGYNLFFLSCFYPEDIKSKDHPLLRSFNEEQFCLLFGGQYDKQIAAEGVPSEIKRTVKVNPQYDEVIMKYRDEFYGMKMPMGQLIEQEEDEGTASIV